MAVKFRDYYEVLGIRRGASSDEIRKAFRGLARKYHPDVAKDKATAEEKFKEINEAYEVLGDPEKRKQYDSFGSQFQHGSDFARASGEGFGQADWGEGVRFEGTGFSDFFEHLFGQMGRRGFPNQGRETARDSRSRQSERGQDIEADILVSIEEIMNGSSRTVKLERPSSRGRPASIQTARVKVPRGISEGQMIRCAGLGQPGQNSGEPGDLYLRVRVQRHPDFRVEGHDLYYQLTLSPWEAVLGAAIAVPTPHGTLQVKIPPGTEAGTDLRLRGKGLPRGLDSEFGDLYVVTSIAVPHSLSAEEKQLWQQLRESSKFDPRKP